MIGSNFVQSVSARIAALKAALLDAATPSNGAGAIGFLYATVYAGNTIGAWLQNLATSAGAGFIGFLQAGAGAILRTMQDKASDTLHLNDFLTAAQKADIKARTITLDCSAALASAIASLPAAGGTVLLPRGKVLLNAAVTLAGPGHVRLVGEGFCEATNNNGTTELVKGAALTSAVLVINSPGARLEHLVVRGAAGNTGDGIQISANSVGLENVAVFSMGNDGVRIGLDAGTNANSWTMVNCRLVSNGRFGLYVSDQVSPTLPNANAGTWLNCVAQSNTNDGVRIGNATLNYFAGGTVEQNGGCGFRFNGAGANYNTVVGMDFDTGNSAGNLRIETGSVYNRVDSSTLFDTAIVDNGTLSQLNVPNSSNAGWYSKGVFRLQMGNPGGASDILTGTGGGYTRMIYGGDAIQDSNAHLIVSSAGLYLGKSTAGKVGFYGAVPVVQSAAWGTPTGAAKLANFPGATATLAQTSAQVAQLIADLKALGVLGV